MWGKKLEGEDDGIKNEVGYVNPSEYKTERNLSDVFLELLPWVIGVAVTFYMLPRERYLRYKWHDIWILAGGIVLITTAFLNRNK